MKLFKIIFAILFAMVIGVGGSIGVLYAYFIPHIGVKTIPITEVKMMDAAFRNSVNQASETLSISVAALEKRAEYYLLDKAEAEKKAKEEAQKPTP